ncbi:hypothetical protein [Streptomyces nigrescens]|uniref:hypothetical protein n=1 Tax=Streptomyces nigrescens TaxID=1920 RepID=UPI003824F235
MPIGPATYKIITDQVRLRVLQFAQNAWTGLGSWRDSDIQAFIDAVVPMVAGGQQQIASLTNAFLAEQVAGLFGGSAAPAGLSPEETSGSALRNGADPREVYRRPAVQMYRALKQGAALDAAVDLGANRIAQLVSTDMQLAKTHAAQQTLRDSKAQYYRRKLHGSKNCALCIVASTQRYRVKDLMPCHPGCQCTPEPIEGSAPHVLDKARLEELHSAVERVTGQKSDRGARGELDYRKILVVRNHGEYGPTLTYKGQAFTGPGDIN